ncbi:hypothetical protein [Mucilaginibacter flavus]|uniref:hypothetical protein n=1 Tax=Mucilaginibacter flavus TaxID=931504 RepID=UPI0025B40661|nr:hypothetical protein [Mucilaginibacter flavus]
MKKSKFLILAGAVILLSFSSCGIFHKGCGCPTFGVTKGAGNKGCADMQISNAQMMS